jgi:hypothetical protein
VEVLGSVALAERDDDSDSSAGSHIFRGVTHVEVVTAIEALACPTWTAALGVLCGLVKVPRLPGALLLSVVFLVLPRPLQGHS